MMGQQRRTESLFYYFRLEEQIPTDHLLRRIDGYVDFSFVPEQLKDFYRATGRPSIDPEVLLRLLLVGYLYGITSERRLMDEVRMHPAYRWFTRLSFDQEIPDHSTFSKNRHGRFRQSGVFREVFEEIVRLCLQKLGGGTDFGRGWNAGTSQRQRAKPRAAGTIGGGSTGLTNGSGIPDGTGAAEPPGRFRRAPEGTGEGIDHRSRCGLGHEGWTGDVGLL